MIKIAICDDSEEFSSILEFKIGKCINELLGAEYEIIRFHSLSKLQAFLDANTVDILFFGYYGKRHKFNGLVAFKH